MTYCTSVVETSAEPHRAAQQRGWRAAGTGLAVLLLLCTTTACPSGGGSKSGNVGGPVRGALEPDDPALADGEHYDRYTLSAAVGDRITVDLTSEAFDPYLVLISPSNQWTENDDFEGSTTHSRLEVIADESGEWVVYATSLDGGQLGAYRFEAATSASDLPGRRYEHGALEQGDEELQDGELADSLRFTGKAGDYVWLDLRSRQFDPYLILIAPDDTQLENDDWRGSLNRSVLGATLPLDGEYEVLVTSASAGETGAWDLTLRQDLAMQVGGRDEEGELAAGDETLRSGELVDEYRFDGVPGQRLDLRLASTDFDTYLVLIDPRGGHFENDDDDDGNSSLRTRLELPGSYRVLVTSYESGESGRYSLHIGLGDVQPLSKPQELQLGELREGRLEPGDEESDSGEYIDRYDFQAEAGTPVEIVMRSTDLDTYLQLVFPDGTALGNDDDWDDAGRSRLELTLPQTGTYTLEASSYDAGEAGDYRIVARRTEAAIPPPLRGAPNRIFALAVGISDYGGRAADLDHTRDDASKIGQALVDSAGVDPGDRVVLLDSEATAGNFRRSLASLSARMTPADELVLFFSGHGGRERRATYQAADPDAVDETLTFYDEDISDDELASLLDAVPGRVLLALDSCFSGGFAKDVISKPGRMGLFSSEEDVTSQVADKFRAGGFLAAFLAEALEGGWADDGDGVLTTLELSYYLQERYRTDVKGGGPDDYVRTEGPQLGYQHLVVDRGSLGPTDILFRLQR